MNRVYCRWAGRPNGTPEDSLLCVVEVPDGGRSALYHQCRRKRGYGSAGLLCKQHAKQEAAGRHLDIPADGEAQK